MRLGGDYELDILQWGKSKENYEMLLNNVSEIYEPEQDKGTVTYKHSKFSEIPEWLFSKKVTSRDMSRFYSCDRITSIPENLFKNCVNATRFYYTFKECRGLISIPENLFKDNVNVTEFYNTFDGCSGLTSLPENLFKYNVNATFFGSIFADCRGLTSLPENLFKHNVNVNRFNAIFDNCRGLTSIPENLFKYNVNATDFYGTFEDCRGLLYIPNTIIEHAKRVKEKGGNVRIMFKYCAKASNYSSLPAYLVSG